MYKWIQADYEVTGMKHSLIARLTYGENWALYNYLNNLRHLEYYTNKDHKSVIDKIFKGYHWLKHRSNHKKLGVYIAPNSIGPGCHLVHYGFRHITQGTKMGANCTILPMVLFGRKTPDVKDFHITIGDNCYISAGVTILGPVTIGNNVTIGAGAVVNKDIPDYTIVAGVPAKKIN